MASQSHPEPEPPPRREAPELPAAEGGGPAFDPLPPGAGPAPVQRWWGRHLSELRWPVEAVRLLSDPVFYGRGLPRGDGRPVVLLPGLLVGDVTLLPMAAWLRRLGYRPYGCRFVVNVDCSERAVERVQRRALDLARRHGRKVALVGHSRGGHFAKVVAVQRPDQVSHVVTVGAGLDRPFDISAPTEAAVTVVRGVLRLTSERARERGCLSERCTCSFAEAYTSPFPPQVQLTSIYTKEDGVVRWRSCVVPYAHAVEVTGTHVGLAYNREVYRALAHALARPAP